MAGPLLPPGTPPPLPQPLLVELLRERQQELGLYLRSSQHAAAEAAGRGWRVRVPTISAGLFLAAFVGMGFLGDVWLVFAMILGLLCLIVFGVALTNDLLTWPRPGETADQAFRRVLGCFQSGRLARAYAQFAPAYAQFAPAARSGTGLLVPPLQTVALDPGPDQVRDLKTFRQYWQRFLVSGSRQVRSLKICRCELVAAGPDAALVEADLELLVYPRWIILTIFGGLIFPLILYYVLRRRERLPLRKLLLRYRDRWYLAEAGYCGPLDRLETLPER